MQYPKDWTISSNYKFDNKSNYDYQIIFNSPNVVESDFPGKMLMTGAQISIKSPLVYGTEDNLIDTAPERLMSDCGRKKLIEILSIDNRKAEKIEYICPGNNSGIRFFIQAQDGLYSIDFQHKPETDNSYQSVFDQILSTFRFDSLTTSKFLNPSVEGKRCGYLPVPGSGDVAGCPNGYTCQGVNPGNDAGGVCIKVQQ